MNDINEMTSKNKTQINDNLFRHNKRKAKVISLIKCCTKGIQSIPAARLVSHVLNYASNKILFCVHYKAVPLKHAISQNIVASFFIASISPLMWTALTMRRADSSAEIGN